MQHLRLSIYVLILSMLYGCDRGTPEYMLQDYMSRVGNTLDTAIDTPLDVAAQIPLFPRKRERWREIPPLTQGLIEVLDLDYCDGLLPLIAERNSNLGRVMQPSQQMVYEIRFHAAIKQCAAKIEADPVADSELKQRINTILRHKQQYLKDRIWNGTIASDEFAANFSRSEPPLPVDEPLDFSTTLTAIERFIELAQLTDETKPSPPPAYLATIEESYQALQLQRYGARLLHSLSLVTVTLEQTAAGINQRLDQRPFCLPGHHTPKRDILRNVFSRYYAAELQPYLALVQRDAMQWFSLQQMLFAQFKLNPEMQRYYDSVLSEEASGSLWRRYRAALEQHTKAWQRLLTQCELMPQRPGNE